MWTFQHFGILGWRHVTLKTNDVFHRFRKFVIFEMGTIEKLESVSRVTERHALKYDTTIRIEFFRLLTTIANSLGKDQDRHNVGPDLNPNRLTPLKAC